MWLVEVGAPRRRKNSEARGGLARFEVCGISPSRIKRKLHKVERGTTEPILLVFLGFRRKKVKQEESGQSRALRAGSPRACSPGVGNSTWSRTHKNS